MKIKLTFPSFKIKKTPWTLEEPCDIKPNKKMLITVGRVLSTVFTNLSCIVMADWKKKLFGPQEMFS